MPDNDRFLDLAIDVARLIAAAAEPDVAGSRWRTRTYFGEDAHGTDVFAGSAGPVILLANLHGITGDTRHRDVAESGALWIEAQTRRALTATDRDPSLYFGVAGDGMTFLHLYESTGRERWLNLVGTRVKALRGIAYGDEDILVGAAGAGIFLLRAHQVTGDAAALDLAVAAGEHLLQHASVDDGGWHWPWHRGSGTFNGVGFAHGTAGIACTSWRNSHAIQVTHVCGSPRWGPRTGSTRMPRLGRRGDAGPATSGPRVCSGATGRRASGCLRSAPLRRWGTTRSRTWRCAPPRRRTRPGTSGRTPASATVWPATPSYSWSYGASWVTTRGSGEPWNSGRRRRPTARRGRMGPSWRGDEPGNYSPDFMMGSAGVGHFFLRLARPDTVDMPLMAAPVREGSQ